MSVYPHRFQDCRILHVDDSEDDAFLFRRALERLGYEGHYEWVDSEETALSRLSEADTPNVIVADGYRAAGPASLHSIREALAGEDIPIVVYSGESDKHAMEEALRNGATAYLLKRTSFEESVTAVARILELCH